MPNDSNSGGPRSRSNHAALDDGPASSDGHEANYSNAEGNGDDYDPGISLSEAWKEIMRVRKDAMLAGAGAIPQPDVLASAQNAFQQPQQTLFYLLTLPENAKVKRLCVFMTILMFVLPISAFFVSMRMLPDSVDKLLYSGAIAAVVVNLVIGMCIAYVLKFDQDVIHDDNDPRLLANLTPEQLAERQKSLQKRQGASSRSVAETLTKKSTNDDSGEASSRAKSKKSKAA